MHRLHRGPDPLHAPDPRGPDLRLHLLDYHHTLQAASGDAAEQAREQAMQANAGQVPGHRRRLDPDCNEHYSTIAGISNLQMLKDDLRGRRRPIINVGTCAAFGGLPMAEPNPTGAVAVGDIITDKPIINVPGCPPMPLVITGVLAQS
jgi:hydrogenase small subunit